MTNPSFPIKSNFPIIVRSFTLKDLPHREKTDGGASGYVVGVGDKTHFLKTSGDVTAAIFNACLLKEFGVSTPNIEAWVEEESGIVYLAAESVENFQHLEKQHLRSFSNQRLNEFVQSISDAESASKIRSSLLLLNLILHDAQNANIGFVVDGKSSQICAVDLDYIYQSVDDAINGTMDSTNKVLGQVTFSASDVMLVKSAIDEFLSAGKIDSLSGIPGVFDKYKDIYKQFLTNIQIILKEFIDKVPSSEKKDFTTKDIFGRVAGPSRIIETPENRLILNKIKLCWLDNTNPVSDSVRMDLEQGLEAMISNKYEAAINHFLNAQKKGYSHSHIYYNLGCACNKLKKSEDAIKYFNLAQELGCKYADLYYQRGVAKYDIMAKDFDKKSELYSSMIEDFDQVPTSIADAIRRGRSDVAKILIEANFDVNKPDSEHHKPPLFYAFDVLVATGTEDALNIVQLLIAKGADVDCEFRGSNAAILAINRLGGIKNENIRKNLIAGIKILINKISDVNKLGSDNRSLLLHATDALANTGDESILEIVQLLISKGADVNSKFIGRSIALFLVNHYKSADQNTRPILIRGIKLLVNEGANVDDAIFFAVDMKDVAILKALLSKIPNANLIDRWGIHIIVKAVESGVPEIVQLFIDAGVDLLNSNTNLNGKTILEVAENLERNNPSEAATAIANQIRTTIAHQEENLSSDKYIKQFPEGQNFVVSVDSASLSSGAIPLAISNPQTTSEIPEPTRAIARVKLQPVASFNDQFLFMVWVLRFLFGFKLKQSQNLIANIEYFEQKHLNDFIEDMFGKSSFEEIFDLKNHPGEEKLLKIAFSARDASHLKSLLKEQYPENSEEVFNELEKTILNLEDKIKEREKNAIPLTKESLAKVLEEEKKIKPASNPVPTEQEKFDKKTGRFI